MAILMATGGTGGGDVPLEVRARMGSGTSARELRIERLDSTLTVLPTNGITGSAGCWRASCLRGAGRSGEVWRSDSWQGVMPAYGGWCR